MKSRTLTFLLMLCCVFITHAQIITTVAGSSSVYGFGGDGGPATLAQFSRTWGMAIDAAGNIYVADYGNNRIRIINTAGIISTFAGNGISGFGGDGGPATAAWMAGPTGVAIHGTDVYFVDNGNARVRKVDASGIITTVAGNGIGGYSGDGGAATLASISNDNGLWVDGAGNIYIPDRTTNRLRKVDPAGIITTIAGNGVSGFSGDGGPATLATFNLTNDVSVDGAGNIYISDWMNNRIRLVNTAGIISTAIGTGVYGWSGDGGPATAATVRGPMGLEFNGAGDIYLCDADNFLIRKINPAGIITTIAGTGTPGFSGDGGPPLSAQFYRPVKAVYWSGMLFVSDKENNRIRRITFGNTPPHFAGGHSQNMTVCQNATATNIDTLLAVTDPDFGQTETWSLILAPLHGIAVATYSTTSTGGILIPSGLTYTPNTGYLGNDSFKVRISDGPGADTTTIYVTVTTTPTPGTLSGPSSVCQGSTILLSASISGGIWSSSNGHASVTGGLVTGLSAGVDTIIYTIVYSCGTAVATKAITVNPLPNAGTINGTTSLCVGFSITLTDTVAGGVWSSSNTKATVSASGVVTGVSIGLDTIIYSVTNYCGTATARKIINVSSGLPNAGVITGLSNVCAGAAITLSDTATGGKWLSSAAGIATIDSNSGLLTGITAGNCVISYTVTNSCGSSTVTKSITVNPLPSAGTITGLQRVCTGAVTTLLNAVTGGKWSSSNTTVATIDSLTGTITALSPGTTTITYTTAPNVFGCTNKTTFPFTVLSVAPFVMTDVLTPINCNGEKTGGLAVSISGGTGNYHYTWSTGDSSAALYGLAAGIYTLHVKDGLTMCAADYTYPLNQPEQLGVTDQKTNDFCKAGAGSITLTVTGGTIPYTYTWTDNSTGNPRTALHSGIYIVLVKDVNSCIISDTIEIKDDTCKDLQIHDVITPNGDGINDVWVIEEIQKYPDNTVQVFDKWGDMVFEKKDYNNDWNGRVRKGELLPDGTYYYLVKLNATNAFGGKNIFTGTILIKR